MPITIEADTLGVRGFSEKILGLSLYDWQVDAVLPIEAAFGPDAKRQNIAVVAPNGSGKDDRIIPAAVYYWMFFNPQGQVVITSKSATQLEGQTIPSLKKHFKKFGWDDPVTSPRFQLRTPTGGIVTAFVTNEGSRFEGWHSKPGQPLMVIANEAKFLDDRIYDGIDKCTVDVLMLISSPGLMKGRFYEAFTKLRQHFTCIQAGLSDCPHIPKERIELTLAAYGEHNPHTRSTLYGEFMESSDEEPYVLSLKQAMACINHPPTHVPGFRYGFFDFAEGRAENVLVIRNGNKFEIADAWKEPNEDAVIGRAIQLLRKHELTAEQAGGDAAAKNILDGLASAGLPIHRQNFGSAINNKVYKSWSAFAWLDGAQKIIRREVIIPDDEVLIGQITDRKKIFADTGKLGVEEKYVMAKRNVKSPDRADALFGCMAAMDTGQFRQAQAWHDYQDEEKTNEAALAGASVGW